MKKRYSYYAYGLTELNADDLPQEDLIEVEFDLSETFCGIALYKEKLKRKDREQFNLVYLGVYYDEE